MPRPRVPRPSSAAAQCGCWCGRVGRRRSPRAARPASDRLRDAPLDGECFGIAATLHHQLKRIVMRRIERPGFAHAVAGRMRRIKMRAGDPALRNGLGGGMGSAAPQQFWQHMRVRPLRALAGRRRDRLIDLDAADPADEDAVRIGGSIMPIAGLPGSNTARPVSSRNRAARLGSPMRTQKSACSAPRPRSNRIDPRSSGRSASRSGPSSVNTLRRFIAQSSAGRQSATRWLQPVLVMLSNANGRLP